jgi:hypothetical protein
VDSPEGCAAAPRGAPPILDDKCQNVPLRGGFTRKHYRVRARIRDFMRLHRYQGRILWWCTLTSSPDSPGGRLRADFQAWRKRLSHLLGLPEAGIQYAMVDTLEGHGVLHFVLSFPPGVGAWLDYGRLGESWQELHGARQVKFKRIRQGDGDTRRLSHYLVSQYMVRQGETVDLLGRFSSSRLGVPLSRWRRELRGLLVSRARAYAWAKSVLDVDPRVDGARLLRQLMGLQWREYRRCWGDLLLRHWCEGFGERFLIEGDRVVPL